MGNIYVFLLAGHDTTAHTLAFALTLLAIYPEIQQKAVEHIEDVLSPGVDPVSQEAAPGAVSWISRLIRQ